VNRFYLVLLFLLNSKGCSLSQLWANTELDSACESNHTRDAAWLRLRSQPELSCTPQCDAQQSMPLDAAEALGLTMVAALPLRERVLGLNDVAFLCLFLIWPLFIHLLLQPYCKLNIQQFSVLEIIGKARKDGVLQSRLAKQMNIDNKTLFHVVKVLKSRGLV